MRIHCYSLPLPELLPERERRRYVCEGGAEAVPLGAAEGGRGDRQEQVIEIENNLATLMNKLQCCQITCLTLWNRFGVDELKEMLAACGGKSMPFFEVISALNTHGENISSAR